MAAISKIYSISYWSEVNLIDPVSGDTFYKVKSVIEKNGGSLTGIVLTKREYDDWKKSLTPYHYINSEKYKVKDAYINNEQKIEDETKSTESLKELNVYSNWNLYKNYDSIGNSMKSDELKLLSRNNAILLPENGKKSFIITQMTHLKTKISVYEDLELDTTDLQFEYNELILEFNSINVS